MAEVYLEARRDFLLRTQNLDGGWGYFPGKSSWLEPTAYAMLALHGDPKAAAALERAWTLLGRWQLPDGSWRAGSEVQDGTWVSALAVTLCCVDARDQAMCKTGVDRLLAIQGEERCLTFRLMAFFGLAKVEGDTRYPAWPWRPGTSSWIEPTAHTIVALKHAQKRLGQRHIAERVREGEEAVLVRRCHDGGWNHGSSSTFHIAAPSYPESTALALLGLQGRHKEIGRALDMARASLKTTRSPLAKAWLGIALQTWGDTLSLPDNAVEPGRDTMIVALEAIAHPEGNHALLRTEAKV